MSKREIQKIKSQDIVSHIFTIRDVHVMVDTHLAEMYEVETRILNQAVKRNMNRFPESFRFQLTQKEYQNLRSQIVILSGGGSLKPVGEHIGSTCPMFLQNRV